MNSSRYVALLPSAAVSLSCLLAFSSPSHAHVTSVSRLVTQNELMRTAKTLEFIVRQPQWKGQTGGAYYFKEYTITTDPPNGRTATEYLNPNERVYAVKMLVDWGAPGLVYGTEVNMKATVNTNKGNDLIISNVEWTYWDEAVRPPCPDAGYDFNPDLGIRPGNHTTDFYFVNEDDSSSVTLTQLVFYHDSVWHEFDDPSLGDVIDAEVGPVDVGPGGSFQKTLSVPGSGRSSFIYVRGTESYTLSFGNPRTLDQPFAIAHEEGIYFSELPVISRHGILALCLLIGLTAALSLVLRGRGILDRSKV